MNVHLADDECCLIVKSLATLISNAWVLGKASIVLRKRRPRMGTELSQTLYDGRQLS